MSEVINVAKLFGEDVFNDTVMQERLPKKVYKLSLIHICEIAQGLREQQGGASRYY